MALGGDADEEQDKLRLVGTPRAPRTAAGGASTILVTPKLAY